MFQDLLQVASTTSDRVKSLEFHPTEPLLAASLYNGMIIIFKTNNLSILRTICVTAEHPIRCVRWMPSLNLLIAAGDNRTISCFDPITGSLISSQTEAHTDFIRQIAIHPTQTQFLSCSDDCKVNLYSVTKNGLTVIQKYEGHTHYVMDVKFNPVDDGVTFATASLDGTVKLWELTAKTPKFTLSGHQAGVNCVEFLPDRNKRQLASGSDDFSIKIWDWETQSCVVTLSGHHSNVTGLKFHSWYQILLSIGEDEMMNVWNTVTFQNESAVDNQKKRGWCIDTKLNLVAGGYDEGLVLLKIGEEQGQVTIGKDEGLTFDK
jgi:coatomer subunit beta'